jgi:hypothetical protein
MSKKRKTNNFKRIHHPNMRLLLGIAIGLMLVVTFFGLPDSLVAAP